MRKNVPRLHGLKAEHHTLEVRLPTVEIGRTEGVRQDPLTRKKKNRKNPVWDN